jgi:hypothetical protein
MLDQTIKASITSFIIVSSFLSYLIFGVYVWRNDGTTIYKNYSHIYSLVFCSYIFNSMILFFCAMISVIIKNRILNGLTAELSDVFNGIFDTYENIAKIIIWIVVATNIILSFVLFSLGFDTCIEDHCKFLIGNDLKKLSYNFWILYILQIIIPVVIIFLTCITSLYLLYVTARILFSCRGTVIHPSIPITAGYVYTHPHVPVPIHHTLNQNVLNQHTLNNIAVQQAHGINMQYPLHQFSHQQQNNKQINMKPVMVNTVGFLPPIDRKTKHVIQKRNSDTYVPKPTLIIE